MQQPGFSEVDPHPLSCLTWGQLSRIQIQIQIQKDTNTDEDTKPNKSVIQIPGSPDTQKSYPLFISPHLGSALRTIKTNTNTYSSKIQMQMQKTTKVLIQMYSSSWISQKLIPLFGVTSLHLISYIIFSDYLQP